MYFCNVKKCKTVDSLDVRHHTAVQPQQLCRQVHRVTLDEVLAVLGDVVQTWRQQPLEEHAHDGLLLGGDEVWQVFGEP